ncbi:MAG TPA: hypothetical protein VKO84_09190 [Gaiellaceae bacterium]|nr:hypothetical protein [Gaiellaceae bacterium]
MVDDPLQRRANDLTVRIQAFAEALRDCGVPEEISVALLANAAAAVLQALSLEAMATQSGRLAA